MIYKTVEVRDSYVFSVRSGNANLMRIDNHVLSS